MRSWIGLLIVSGLGLGACADDEPDRFVPQFPQTPSAAESNQPYVDTLYDFSRQSRARYERLRLLGFLR